MVGGYNRREVCVFRVAAAQHFDLFSAKIPLFIDSMEDSGKTRRTKGTKLCFCRSSTSSRLAAATTPAFASFIRLGDRELADIGISRSDIPRVAWEAANRLTGRPMNDRKRPPCAGVFLSEAFRLIPADFRPPSQPLWTPSRPLRSRHDRTPNSHQFTSSAAASPAAKRPGRSRGRGVPVVLHEMRPGARPTPTRPTPRRTRLFQFIPLRRREHNAVGLLHDEMRRLGSLIMRDGRRQSGPGRRRACGRPRRLLRRGHRGTDATIR